MASNGFEIALQRHRAGQLAEAERLHRRVLQRDPGHARAAFLLGGIALGAGRAGEALPMLSRAAELDPRNGAFHANLGEALRRLGRFGEALAAFERAVALQPDRVEPIFNLGLLLQDAGEMAPAIACFELAAARRPDEPAIRRSLDAARAAAAAAVIAPAPHAAIAIAPRDGAGLGARAWLALSAACGATGDRAAAIAHGRRALACDPRWTSALVQLGAALADAGETDEASEHLARALEIDPGHKEALARLLEVLESSCRLDEAVALLRRCLQIVDAPTLHSLLVLTLPYLPDHDARAILAEARAWDREHAAAITARAPRPAPDRSADRRLRIGYVAPYFRDHAHKFFLEPLLSNHDRRAFELFFYSDAALPDDETARVRAQADAWRDSAALSDDDLAATIRADRVDILVDLAMHTQNHRLLVFARRPAPVQICWLAYPGTTGLTAMDYRVTDPHLDPEGSDLSVYTERSLFLPETFWCYSPRTEALPPTPLPALAAGHVTFGCLNNFCKVNEPVLALWAQILSEAQGAKLLLLAPRGDVRRNALRVLARGGVDGDRVEFVDRRPRAEYLATYARVDVALDPFPCSGHTTSLDALWMGVPVVTWSGQTCIGRAGACFAKNLGLPELVAGSAAEYAGVAVALARDWPRLAALRAELRPRMEASPLMDGPRFAKNLEALYRRAWSERCAVPDLIAP